MAVSAWAASTSYSVGDIRRAATAQVTGLFFKCTTAGTSASSEPKWGTDIGSTATDNNIIWTAISSTYEELSKLAPSAIIELWELNLDNTLHGATTVYRWHNGVNAAVTGDIVWAGNTYLRQPIEANGFEYSSANTSLPRPTLTIGNIATESSGSYVNVAQISALLLLVNETTPGNDLGGATVKRIRTLKKFLDGEATADPFATFPEEIWYIDRKSSESRSIVSFELASKFDLAGVILPKRQLIANVCQWGYRSSECSYSGSNYWDAEDNTVSTLGQDRCWKRLSSCKKRFGDNAALPFGSFPSAGLTK